MGPDQPPATYPEWLSTREGVQDMPDNDDILDEDDPQDSSVIRELRKQLRDAKAEAAEVPELRRKAALSDAGLSTLTATQQRALWGAHEGDPTPDALKATAADLKFIEVAEPEPQVKPEVQQGIQQTQEAFNGAEGAEARPETLEDRILAAKNPDEVLQLIGGAGLAQDYGDAPSE